MNLTNKTALVTGASSGIGKSFAYLLASKRMNLVIVARTISQLELMADEISNKYQVKVLPITKDLSIKGASQELYDRVKREQVEVDLLINNAGFGKWGEFTEFSMEDYHNMIQLNITALMDLTYLFMEAMKQKPEAGIINLGSTASFLPVPFSSVYAATKAFVLSFSEGLVGELEGTQVKVHCLCPDGTATNFAKVANPEVDTSTVDMKSPDDVAREGLDAFLAGKHFSVTGRKYILFITRILSRMTIINMVAKAWKKRIGSISN
ncbi:MAG: SDR family oxidoreductase [Bacteroidota bacterium]